MRWAVNSSGTAVYTDSFSSLYSDTVSNEQATNDYAYV
jgi:hypothetical protein